MKILLKYKLDVNHIHDDGYAPIHRACWGSKSGHTEVIKLLL